MSDTQGAPDPRHAAEPPGLIAVLISEVGGLWGQVGTQPRRWGVPFPPAPLLPVLNQPSQVKAFLVSSGLSQYSRNTDGPLTKSSPSFSVNPGVTYSTGEKHIPQSTHLAVWGSPCLPRDPWRHAPFQN